MKKSGIILAAAVMVVALASAELYLNDILIPAEQGESAFQASLRRLEGSFRQAPAEEQPASVRSGTRTVYFSANGQRIAKRVNNETFYFHNDHLGSPAVITDSKGNVVEEKVYDPFGMELAGGSKIGYNSKELDKDTGLNYYGARYYGSESGRFITPDSVKGELSDPQSLNLYSYVFNNPLKQADPTGNQPKTALTKTGGGLSAQVTGKVVWQNANNAPDTMYAKVTDSLFGEVVLKNQGGSFQLILAKGTGRVLEISKIEFEDPEAMLKFHVEETKTSGPASGSSTPEPQAPIFDKGSKKGVAARGLPSKGGGTGAGQQQKGKDAFSLSGGMGIDEDSLKALQAGFKAKQSEGSGLLEKAIELGERGLEAVGEALSGPTAAEAASSSIRKRN